VYIRHRIIDNESAATNGGQGKLAYSMYFHLKKDCQFLTQLSLKKLLLIRNQRKQRNCHQHQIKSL